MQDFTSAFLAFSVLGYLAQRLSNRTRFRFRAVTQKWEQTVFEAGVAGACVFGVAMLLASAINAFIVPLLALATPPLPAAVMGLAGPVKGFPAWFSGSLLLALAIEGLALWASNSIWLEGPELLRTIRDYGGELRVLLHEIAEEGALASLTMKNRKVYVGYITTAPGLMEPSYVGLLPIISGYRDDETLRVRFTTRYQHVYEEMASEQNETDLDRFVMVLPLDNIESANEFDSDIYDSHFSGEPKQALWPRMFLWGD